MGSGKPRGINAARKLKNRRKINKWANKNYKKMHIVTRWKKPFEEASQAKGIVIEKLAKEAK